MKETLEKIYANAINDINNATKLNDIEQIKLNYLSRKGELNNIRKNIKDLSIEDKKIVGALANKITNDIEQLLKDKYDEFYTKELNEKLQNESIDVTLPGSCIQRGKIHPLNQTINEIVEIFQGMGFSLIKNENNPEVETEYINFDCLNFPPDHPAKDMQDTFYTEVASNVILRSQTSGSQIREMLSHKPPVRIIAPGRVYRCESVSARKNNLFHQIEGLLVDKHNTK